jgi:CHAT domain-containing protein/tetratricopeptide (TPR) repeat protein
MKGSHMLASTTCVAGLVLLWGLAQGNARDEQTISLDETKTVILSAEDPPLEGHGPARSYLFVAESTGPGAFSTNAQATIEAEQGARYRVFVTGARKTSGEFTLAARPGPGIRLVAGEMHDAAAAFHERGAQRARARDDVPDVLYHLVRRGEYLWFNSKFTAAKPCFEEALSLATRSNIQWAVGEALRGLGVIQAHAGHGHHAFECHKQSLAIFRELGDVRNVGRALLNVATTYLILGQPSRARACAERAEPYVSRAGDVRAQIGLRHLLSLTPANRSEEKVQDYLGRTVQLARKHGDGLTAGRALLNLAYSFLESRDFAAARDRARRALKIARDAKDPGLECGSHITLSQISLREGDFSGAKEHAYTALAIAQSVKHPSATLQVLPLLSRALLKAGELAKARRCAEEALFLARLESIRSLEELSLGVMALVDMARGHYPAAEWASKERVAIAKEHLDPEALGLSLASLGKAHTAFDHNEKARRCILKSLPLLLEFGRREQYATALGALGMCYRDVDPRKTALCLDRALSIATAFNATDLQTSLLTSIAQIELERGEIQAAWQRAKRSLAFALETDGQEAPALALTVLGRCALGLGRPLSCAVLLSRAESLMERTSVALDEALGAAAWRSRWTALGYALQDLGGSASSESSVDADSVAPMVEQSFAANGKWKAWALRMGLHEHRAGRRTPTLVRTRQERRALLRERDKALLELTTAISRGHDELARTRARVDRLHQELKRLEELLEATSSVDRLVEERPSPSLDRIRPLLPEGTVLIDFSEGHSRLYAYVATRSGLIMHDLGPREKIYADARAFGTLVSSHPGAPEAREILEEVGHSLYLTLLAPLLKDIGDGVECLVISPTPELAALPFEALVIQPGDRSGRGGSSSGPEYVLDRFEVAYAPSVPVLLEIDAMGSRKDGRFLVLADPLYPSESPNHESKPDPIREEIRTWRMAPDPREFERLEKSRLEALAVVTALSRESLRDASTLAGLTEARSAKLERAEIDLYLGAEASRMRLLENPSQYRVIHVAAHGIVDRQTPMRSGIALAFEEGDAGFVSLEEVTELDLDASLVVLSACNTARGEVVVGDGVQSLAWAIIYAGARSVVASLWRVADSETASLMETFYRGHLEQGLPPSQALRKAKLALRRGAGLRLADPSAAELSRSEAERRAHPFFWAPFVYIGLPR